jgi:hypothetical protein
MLLSMASTSLNEAADSNAPKGESKKDKALRKDKDKAIGCAYRAGMEVESKKFYSNISRPIIGLEIKYWLRI